MSVGAAASLPAASSLALAAAASSLPGLASAVGRALVLRLLLAVCVCGCRRLTVGAVRRRCLPWLTALSAF